MSCERTWPAVTTPPDWPHEPIMSISLSSFAKRPEYVGQLGKNLLKVSIGLCAEDILQSREWYYALRFVAPMLFEDRLDIGLQDVR